MSSAKFCDVRKELASRAGKRERAMFIDPAETLSRFRRQSQQPSLTRLCGKAISQRGWR